MPILQSNVFSDYWVQIDGFVIDTYVIEGDSVKLKNPRGESFWVIVTGVYGTTFTGTVNNHLILGSDYNYNDSVTFKLADIREHKDSESKNQQAQMLRVIIQELTEILGYVPSIEEVESLFTRFSRNLEVPDEPIA